MHERKITSTNFGETSKLVFPPLQILGTCPLVPPWETPKLVPPPLQILGTCPGCTLVPPWETPKLVPSPLQILGTCPLVPPWGDT